VWRCRGLPLLPTRRPHPCASLVVCAEPTWFEPSDLVPVQGL